jgi:hypothetical protein
METGDRVEAPAGPCCAANRMSGARDDETPDRDCSPTRRTATYNDALLSGRLTRAELELIRAEMAGGLPVVDEDERAAGAALARVKERLDAADYAGALALAERAYEAAPRDVAARRYVEICRKTLGRVYLSRLGAGADVPEVVTPPPHPGALQLDRWAAFMLAAVDGRTTIEELCDIAGMTRLDALRVLHELVKQGVVRVRGRL